MRIVELSTILALAGSIKYRWNGWEAWITQVPKSMKVPAQLLNKVSTATSNPWSTADFTVLANAFAANSYCSSSPGE
ncbi:hypothetical protein [Peribacillus sp. SI8-4]|uniref:hypothetical protein n=1 Tax=Peribacillus sp. SI8-4 TaxID=3048009 RepID=UPI002557A179|nr:hypothetical protein [Peribacillus sp. SI8-4]